MGNFVDIICDNQDGSLLFLNIDDIARLSYDFCYIVVKTPLPDGRHIINLSIEEFDRVVKVIRQMKVTQGI